MAENYDNLKEAMKMEKEYRKLQADHKAKTEFRYRDKLKAFGFNDTIEYERTKAEYYLRTTKVVVKSITQSQSNVEIAYAIKENIPTLLLAIPDKEVAYIGNETVIDKAYCERNEIPVVTLNRGGGVIVSNPNDIAFVYITDKDNMMPVFTERTLAMLQRFHKNTVIDGNDFLMGGYKVAAYGEIGRFAYCIHFSFTVDIEKINAISTKEMVKEPRGLGNLCNITREDVVAEVMSWLP